MAHEYLHIGTGTSHGASLIRAMEDNERDLENLFNTSGDLFDHRNNMIRMRDGDGSSAAHYAEVTARYGTPSDAVSKALFDELAAYCGVLENGSSTATQMKAAAQQFYAKAGKG